VNRHSLDSNSYSVSCIWGDGRYHVWVDADTKKMKPGDNTLYKNALPGAAKFDTRYLKADLAKNADMIQRMLGIAEAQQLFLKCDAKLREKQEAEDRENEAAYREELKKQAGPRLYDALKNIVDLYMSASPPISALSSSLRPFIREAQAALVEADGVKPVRENMHLADDDGEFEKQD
jgi:metal-dependent amidase/aminoacylase/carboxypeptidase family protein